jgi:hypothetical protein
MSVYFLWNFTVYKPEFKGLCLNMGHFGPKTCLCDMYEEFGGGKDRKGFL